MIAQTRLIGLSIAQFLVAGLLAGRQSVLELQPLVLVGADLGGRRIANGLQVIVVQSSLLGELPPVPDATHLRLLVPTRFN